MPYLEIGDRKIYYQLHGKGEPIVLMHHGFASLQMWKDIYPHLVQAGFQVLLYDRRGYGRSDRGDDFWEFYVSDRFRTQMVEDLAALLEALDLGPVHLAGQCEGGVISVDFAVAHPERVRSLVLGSVQTWSLTDMVTFNAQKFPLSFAELDPALRDKFALWHGPQWGAEFYDRARPKGGAYGVGFFDLRPQLARVSCPALVIYPDRSALFDVEQGVAMYRVLPRAELAVMPYCGHNIYEYRPGQYLELVLGFYHRLAQGLHADKAPGHDHPDPNQRTCAT